MAGAFVIDRRTYLAGQALAGIVGIGAKSAVPVEVTIRAAVDYANEVLAELQRTCKHQWWDALIVADDPEDLVPGCRKCGAEKPSGGNNAE